MESKKYYVGFDIGTDSVGYAVTDENYSLTKFKGEPMWGVTLFDEAQTAAGRRAHRTARRRLDRRQQRVRLTMDLFAEEICKMDPDFFCRIKESYHYPENDEDKVRLFNTYDEQKEYVKNYPTIHHLISDLMKSKEPHDVRLVYLACAWLVAHRGHFLSEVDKQNIEAVRDFRVVYHELVQFIERDGEYALPWDKDIDLKVVESALKSKLGIPKKIKAVTEALFGTSKAPKNVNEEYEFNYELVVRLMCGGTVKLKELFDKEEYADLEEKSVALNMDDEKLAGIMQSIGDDSALISVLKKVYDWSVLVDMLKGQHTISEAKVEIYRQHQRDLSTLKHFVKAYRSEKYDEIFRSEKNKTNYVAYIGKNKTSNESIRVKKTVSRSDFCKYIQAVFKGVTPIEADAEEFKQMLSRLEASDFMPKQVDGDNRVIPYQLYWFELNKILENAKTYLPFLNAVDEEGISVAQKILSVFEFRVPYYVGPLKEARDRKYNHWMVRKATGKIYPWNFENMVDLDKSEDKFIERLTNSCTYLPGEDVLPKCSLVYSAFEVLNEINNIKINGSEIPVSVKQGIYNEVFMTHPRVTLKKIRDHLLSNNLMGSKDVLSGLDITIKSSLKSFLQFQNLIRHNLLTYSQVEQIINRAAYSEDRHRFAQWLKKEYPNLSDNDRKYVSKLNFKGFGRLSKRLLCGIQGVDNDTGEYFPSILRAMWETNCNIMQILSGRFTFKEQVDAIVKEYYDLNPKSIADRLDEMYVSNAVKRPIIRTLDILKDVVKVQGCAPERIFIEMARGATEEQKGKRTQTRRAQIDELYKKVDDEDSRLLTKQLEQWGDTAHNRLQSDKLFLYFLQLGKCLYTGKTIDLQALLSGDGTYNIEHIYPRSFVKDDSIINNKILVDSKVNGDKSDSFPISSDVQNDRRGQWEYLKAKGAISDEKFKRLTRTTHFTEEEKFEFINRQLVETRQSTKAVAALLKELYPATDVVYVKAGLVSDFRKQFDLLKSRAVNDLHHAKDAYLNIVAGNVWHCKFSKPFWRAEQQNNAKVEVVFNHPVVCGGKTIWSGASHKDKVINIARKNTPHVTMYSYYKHSGQNGGFFDQNPVPASKDLIPLKEGRPTELYGGYRGATVAGFVLAKYNLGKKTEVSFVPLKLLDMAKFMADSDFAMQYVAQELGDKAGKIEILLNKRILKIRTMITLDKARYCIRGTTGGTRVVLMNMMQLVVSPEIETYIKKLERLTEKHKQNENFVWDEKFDGVSLKENMSLYHLYIQKLSAWPYSTRPGNDKFVQALQSNAVAFEKLDVFEQAKDLLQIQGVLSRAVLADINNVKETGKMTLAFNLSNWKKNYTDVRIVDQSASGLFETVSDNLMELL